MVARARMSPALCAADVTVTATLGTVGWSELAATLTTARPQWSPPPAPANTSAKYPMIAKTPLFALLLTAVRAQTTPIVIANFQTQFGLDWGPMTALAAIYSIPVVLLTLVLQRHIVAGLTLGAVKG